MNAHQFLTLAKSDKSLSKADYLKIAKLQEAFPYFLIPHILASKFEMGKGKPEDAESLGFSAVNTSNRALLKEILDGNQTNGRQETEESSDLLPEANTHLKSSERTQSLRKLGEEIKGTSKPKITKARRRKPKNDELIENIKKREKKPVADAKLLEQRDLIKAFSKKSIKLATIKEIEANQNNENLAESSTHVNQDLISEPLAKLMISQGKKAEAIKIYKKLQLKFPKKKAYFADLIENLKD
ncbi:hypothetical protein [Algoriphagus sediminis]|uniref:Tetratricopeptide repeat protein n=1 Tax=Algoriphagus sediminis TaxID=3057113 RepID=A0ABT7Y7S7_9BACT|nr:hypothetical protein [Algoriphagus sediminis]MDN3202542.1 hypothetical protein [Algoriphagus sediminis]